MYIQLLAPLIIYFFILIAFNLYLHIKHRKQSSKATSTKQAVKEYSLSNRKLPALALAMTSASTYASASSFISGPGSAYLYGIGWIVLAMIQVPTMWFAFMLLGKKINEYTTKYNVSTINDLLYVRYKSKFIVGLASLIIVVFFIVSIVVQLIGAAKLLQGTLGIEYRLSLIIFTCVIALYTVIGNFKNLAYTDVIQGFIMIVGSIFLLYSVIEYAGGLTSLMTTIKQVKPQAFEPLNDVITLPLLASFWVLVCFGVAGLPQTILRTMANEDVKERNKAILIATVALTVVVLGMHLAGFFSIAIIEQGSLGSSDLIIPAIITKILTPTVAGIFMIAPIASIISTIDSLLIQTTSTVVNDLYLNLINPIVKEYANKQANSVENLSSNSKINSSKTNSKSDIKSNIKSNIKNRIKITGFIKITTACIIAIACLFSFNPPQIIIWLNIITFGGLQVTFLWPIVLGIFFPSIKSQSVLTGMIVGILVYSALVFTKIKFFDLHQIIPGLLASLVSLLFVQIVLQCKKVQACIK